MQTLQTETNKLSFYTSELQSGTRPKGGVRGIESGIPSIGGEHVNNLGGFDFSSIKYVPMEFADSMNRGKVSQNDILIVKDGATTGKVSFVDESFPYKRAVINEHVFIVRTKENIIPKFLFWFLWSQKGQQEILSNFKGSAQGGINTGFIEGVDVPSISIEDQKRAVKQLDELIPNTWNSKSKLKVAKSKIAKFRQYILAAAFKGELTRKWRSVYPSLVSSTELISSLQSSASVKLVKGGIVSNPRIPNWITCKFENIFSIQTGGTPLRKTDKYYLNGDVPWVKTGEVRNNDIYSAEEFITEIALKETNVKLFPIDTILIAMYGEGKTRGQVGRLKIKASTNQACAALVNPSLPEYMNEYIFLFCQSQYNELRKQSVGGNQPNLNLQKIKNWVIPIPPIEEQKEIVRRVDGYFKLADKVEAQIESAELKVSKLTQAVLAKTFRAN